MRYFLLTLIIFNSHCLFSQRSLSGQIFDQNNNPIVQANIIAEDHISTQIHGFGFSDESGKFIIELDGINDTILLSISHISFNDKKIIVPPNKLELKITLIQRSNEIPEVTISPTKYERMGDTIVFDVQSFIKKDDETIEDIINNLPGITINENGRIHYYGRAISKFYIEGLDLLEGKYRLATQNLGKDNIHKIEILERHQEKQVLHDIIRPNEAAINLRLKDKIISTGTIKSVISSPSLDHLIDFNLFSFAKKTQIHSQLSSNQLGFQNRNKYRNLYDPLKIRSANITFINQIIPPLFLKSQFFRMNNEKLIGINVLNKISKNSELKFYFAYFKERVSSKGEDETIFLNEKNRVNQSYKLNTRTELSELNASLTYEMNSDRYFFRSRNSISSNSTENIGENLFNEIASPENQQLSTLSVTSENEATFKINDKPLTIYSDFSLNKVLDSLLLETTDIFIPNNEFILNSDIQQSISINRINLNNYTNLYFTNNRLSGSMSIGLRSNYLSLLSNWKSFSQNGSIGGGDFVYRNSNTYSEFTPYLIQSYKLDLDKSTWQFSIPIRMQSYNFSDEIVQKEDSGQNIFYGISVENSRKVFKKSNLVISLDHSYDYERVADPFYISPLILQNRSSSINLPIINKTRNSELTISVEAKNQISGKYLKAEGSIFSNSYNLIGVNNSNLNNISFNVEEKRNTRTGVGLALYIKERLHSKLNFAFIGDIKIGKSPVISNDQDVDILYTVGNIKTEFSYSFSKSILSLKPSLLYLSNDLLKTNSMNLYGKVIFLHKTSKIGSMRIEYSPYFVRSNSLSSWNHNLNFEYTKDNIFKKTDLSIKFLNIANVKHFTNFEQSLLYNKFTKISLIPFQVRLSVKTEF